MNEAEHLTKDKIAEYYAATFAEREESETGRHLLLCAACRKRLPAPSVEDFWAALMYERADAEQEATENEETLLWEKAKRSPLFAFLFVPAFFRESRNFAWSGAALIVLFSLSFAIWFGAGRQSDAGKEVAQVFEAEFSSKQNNPAEQTVSPPFQTPVKDNAGSSPISNNSVNPAEPTTAKSNSLKEILKSNNQKTSEKSSQRIAPNNKRENISLTRGGATSVSPCGTEKPIAMTADATGEAVTLKWRKIPKAAKYYLYAHLTQRGEIDLSF